VAYSQKMQSEAYFDQATLEADSAAADEMSGYRPPKGQSLQRMTTLISIFVGGAAVICVLALAIPYLSQLHKDRPTNVLDFWLRLGGARSDQTFERFLQDSIESNQSEFEEMYRNSPAYQLNNSPMYQFNQNQTQWQFPGSK
jgi:hypothetical protein